MSLGSILCHVWNLLDSNRCLELFSESLQLMSQHVLKNCPRLQNDADVDLSSIEGTLDPGPLDI